MAMDDAEKKLLMQNLTDQTMGVIRRTDPLCLVEFATYSIGFDEMDPVMYLEYLKFQDDLDDRLQWFVAQDATYQVLPHSMEDLSHHRWLVRIVIVTDAETATLYRLTFGS